MKAQQKANQLKEAIIEATTPSLSPAHTAILQKFNYCPKGKQIVAIDPTYEEDRLIHEIGEIITDLKYIRIRAKIYDGHEHKPRKCLCEATPCVCNAYKNTTNENN